MTPGPTGPQKRIRLDQNIFRTFGVRGLECSIDSQVSLSTPVSDSYQNGRPVWIRLVFAPYGIWWYIDPRRYGEHC